MRSKYLFTLGILVLLVTSNAFAQIPMKFKTFKAKDFEGAIIAREQVPQLEYFFEQAKGYWTPREEDAIEADHLAKEYLEKYNGGDQAVKASILAILGRLSGYRRQYVGLVEDNGNKTIWINYFYDDGEFAYWTQNLVFVLDGGNSFFRIKVNLNKKECYGFSINGAA